MEKNLSKECKEVMTEVKALILGNVVSDSVSTMDEGALVTNVKALRLVNRLIDLCVDMFEKEDELMDKMNKFLDKYPEK